VILALLAMGQKRAGWCSNCLFSVDGGEGCRWQKDAGGVRQIYHRSAGGALVPCQRYTSTPLSSGFFDGTAVPRIQKRF
jgi:hypothetical protein